MKERPILMCAEMVVATLADLKWNTRRAIKPQPVFEGVESYGDSWKWSKGKDWFSGVTTEQLIGTAGLLHKDRSAYGQVGDRLWVKETFCPNPEHPRVRIAYRADMTSYGLNGGFAYPSKEAPEQGICGAVKLMVPKPWGQSWKPSIFMPRWASRINLEIVSVRVERLQDISEEDAKAEGIMEFTKDGSLKKYWPCDPCEGQIKCAWVDLPRTAKAAFKVLWESINQKGSWDLNPWVWAIAFKRIDAPVI